MMRAPTFEDFKDPRFRELMNQMFAQQPFPSEDPEDYKTRLERLMPCPTERERAWASVLDLVAFDSLNDPDFQEMVITLLERGPKEREDYKARVKKRALFPTERESAWAFVLDLMAHDSRDLVKQVLRSGGHVGMASRATLEYHMWFELMGSHHVAQPDTLNARAFAWALEKRQLYARRVVALDRQTGGRLLEVRAARRRTGQKYVDARFEEASVRVEDIALAVRAVRQINHARGAIVYEPDLIRMLRLQQKYPDHGCGKVE
jgi:hypothetical protein